MKLEHYAKRPLTLAELENRSQGGRLFDKPAGFWISVAGEDDWPEWCRSQEFALESLGCVHDVTLKADARILHLKTPFDIIEFEAEYGRTFVRGSSLIGIHWERVATKHQGIIIAPYQWGCRMDVAFYYTWDCASGCIWDVAAIADIKLRETVA